MNRLLFLVCAVVLGLVIPVSGAHADPLSDALAQNPEPISYRKSAVTDPSGASAECATNQDMDKITCAVTDTKADKHAVYVKWKGANGQSGRFDNHNGSGPNNTVVGSDDGLWRGVDGTAIQWQVCVNLQLDGDNCSGFQTHAVGPNGLQFEAMCEVDPAQRAGEPAVCGQIRSLPDSDGWHLSQECVVSAALAAGGLAAEKGVKGKITYTAKWVPFVGMAVRVGGAGEVIVNCK